MSKSKTIRGKMGKMASWKFFSSNSFIRKSLPDTSILTISTLRSFLQKYQTVYIKPDYGYQGRGVIKVMKRSSGYQFIKVKGAAVQCSTVQELYKLVKEKRRQVIQQGIHITTIEGRPFDIRLLMMRNKDGEWEYAGMLAKVAGEGWIITNKRSKGYVLTVDEALEKSLNMNSDQISVTKLEMVGLCDKSCRKLDRYKRYRQIGFDLAFDWNGRLWIIEQNTDPGWSLFRQLKDSTMYNTINSILHARK